MQCIGLLFKAENGINFAAPPHNADRMALPDGVLPHDELILRLEVG
jgi:hypothetical protein